MIIDEEKERGALIVIALYNDGDFQYEYDEVVEIREGSLIV